MALSQLSPPAAEAFGAFYERYAARLRAAVLRSVRDVSLVDDVVQESMVRAYDRGLHHEGGDAWPWLVTVAKNLARDHHRRRARWPEVPFEEVHGVAAIAPDPGSAALEAAKRQKLARALASVSSRQRRLLVERHVHGLGCGEIAAQEGTSVGAVKAALARARTAVRERLDERPALLPGLVTALLGRLRLVRSLAGAPGTSASPGLARSAAGALVAVFALGLGVSAGDAVVVPEPDPAPPATPRGAASPDPGVPGGATGNATSATPESSTGRQGGPSGTGDSENTGSEPAATREATESSSEPSSDDVVLRTLDAVDDPSADLDEGALEDTLDETVEGTVGGTVGGTVEDAEASVSGTVETVDDTADETVEVVEDTGDGVDDGADDAVASTGTSETSESSGSSASSESSSLL